MGSWLLIGLTLLLVVGFNILALKLLQELDLKGQLGCLAMLAVHVLGSIVVFAVGMYFVTWRELVEVSSEPAPTKLVEFFGRNQERCGGGGVLVVDLSRAIDPQLDPTSRQKLACFPRNTMLPGKANGMDLHESSASEDQRQTASAVVTLRLRFTPFRRVKGGNKTTYYKYDVRTSRFRFTLRRVANRWYVTAIELGADVAVP